MSAPLLPRGDTAEAVLAAYVEIALSRLDRGDAVDPAALCAEHPHLAAQLAAAIGLARGFPERHRAMVGDDVWVGRCLADRYELIACIGAGAMGAVYHARDRELERDVAVKVLHEALVSGTRSTARFLRESRTLATVQHGHVVTVYDRGVDGEGTPFLVTELLRGRSLKDVLERSLEAMPNGASAHAFASADWLAPTGSAELRGERSYLRLLLGWCADVAAGLAAVHAHGILHRDVKPSNLFLTEGGRIVLIDFGIAVRFGDPALTALGSAVGTPWYMAPEQLRDDAHDPRVDVYGLCATLYHMLTLRPPYEGDAAAVLARLLHDDPLPVQRLHAGLPREVRAIVERGLAREAARRYPDAGALERDLRAFLDHRPVSARPIGPVRRTWLRIRRRPTGAAALAAAACCVLLLLLLAWSLRAWDAVRREARWTELWRRVPALLTIEGRPEERIVAALADEHRAAREHLDELLALRPDDDATRLLRAAVSIDSGDHAAATADFELIAARGSSPYLAAVLRRFRAADVSVRGLGALSLDDLPEPDTATDRFVAGFHALRARDSARAEALLSECVDYPPARDVRLLALLGIGTPAALREAYDDALRLEGERGFATARTRHVVGVCHLAAKRWSEAIAPFRESLAIRPDRHGPWHNLGLAHLRLGQLEQARECYERAHALRPWFDNTKSGLAQVHAALGDWSAARDVASSIGAAGVRSYELAATAFTESIAALAAGDDERARTSARTAIAHFEDSLRHERHDKVAAVPSSIEIARAIEGGDLARALVPFLVRLGADPRNSNQIVNLCALLAGRALDAREVGYLRLYLARLATELAPDDAIARDRLERIRADLVEAERAATNGDSRAGGR